MKIIFVKPQCTKLDWFFKCCLQHVKGVTAVNSLHGEKNIFTLSFKSKQFYFTMVKQTNLDSTKR